MSPGHGSGEKDDVRFAAPPRCSSPCAFPCSEIADLRRARCGNQGHRSWATEKEERAMKEDRVKFVEPVGGNPTLELDDVEGRRRRLVSELVCETRSA
jgi:hypothetical protein